MRAAGLAWAAMVWGCTSRLEPPPLPDDGLGAPVAVHGNCVVKRFVPKQDPVLTWKPCDDGLNCEQAIPSMGATGSAFYVRFSSLGQVKWAIDFDSQIWLLDAAGMPVDAFDLGDCSQWAFDLRDDRLVVHVIEGGASDAGFVLLASVAPRTVASAAIDTWLRTSRPQTAMGPTHWLLAHEDPLPSHRSKLWSVALDGSFEIKLLDDVYTLTPHDADGAFLYERLDSGHQETYLTDGAAPGTPLLSVPGRNVWWSQRLGDRLLWTESNPPNPEPDRVWSTDFHAPDAATSELLLEEAGVAWGSASSGWYVGHFAAVHVASKTRVALPPDFGWPLGATPDFAHGFQNGVLRRVPLP